MANPSKLKSPGHCRRCGRYVTERHGINAMFYLNVYCAECVAQERETYRKMRISLLSTTKGT